MKIAFVGADGSQFDSIILADFMQYHRVCQDDNLDFIDLKLGRDFLKENCEYDIVILCYIFIGGDLDYWCDDPSVRISPLHSPKNWRERILQSKAKEIYIFGMFPVSEITGEYIDKLEGFQMQLIEKTFGKIWIYKS